MEEEILITEQPPVGDLKAAYRPIIFRCKAKDSRIVTIVVDDLWFTVANSTIHFDNDYDFFVTGRKFTVVSGSVSANNIEYTITAVSPDANPPGSFLKVAEGVAANVSGGGPKTVEYEKYFCPVVFCDVYLNGVYYKTFSKTNYIQDDGQAPEYEFDIQDALQEALTYNLPSMDGSALEEMQNTFKKVFVKFRNTYLDQDGFIDSDYRAPVQGTSKSAPVAGEGIESNEIYVYNATVQHEEDQEFARFLASYKTGNWGLSSYPLTKRPKVFKLCKNDSSYFPIITDQDPATLCLTYTLAGGTPITTCVNVAPDSPPPACPIVSGITYNIEWAEYGVTQKFTFNWTEPVPPPTMVNVQISCKEAGSSTVITAPLFPLGGPGEITLPLGKYDFTFDITGDCINEGAATINNLGWEGEFIEAVVAVENCTVSFDVTTNVSLPVSITVNGSRELFGGTPGPDDIISMTFMWDGTPFTIDTATGGIWTFRIFLSNDLYSPPYQISNIGTCPVPADLTVINIYSLNTTNIADNIRYVHGNITTDLAVTGADTFQVIITPIFGAPGVAPFNTTVFMQLGGVLFFDIELPHSNTFTTEVYQFGVQLKRLGIESNSVTTSG